MIGATPGVGSDRGARFRERARAASECATPGAVMHLLRIRLHAARIPYRVARHEGTEFPTVYLVNPARDGERAGIVWRCTWQEVLS